MNETPPEGSPKFCPGETLQTDSSHRRVSASLNAILPHKSFLDIVDEALQEANAFGVSSPRQGSIFSISDIDEDLLQRITSIEQKQTRAHHFLSPVHSSSRQEEESLLLTDSDDDIDNHVLMLPDYQCTLEFISPLKSSSVGTAKPSSMFNPSSLSSFVPEEICRVYHSNGMKGSLYPWQVECLTSNSKVLQGLENLIYCAPTSGGKSLIAEILMVRRVLQTGRPAMIVLPFRSLCAEKALTLSQLFLAVHKDVSDFYGSSMTKAPIGPRTGCVVCTIEKANILVNRMLEEGTIDLLSCVVVDELHMVGDEDRGYQLELLLTKLRYAAGPCDDEGLQIIGMSATLPNAHKVAEWLSAALYVTDYRPIELSERVLIGNLLQDKNGVVIRELCSHLSSKEDPDMTACLVYETAAINGNSVLVFCGTKGGCQLEAKRLARLMAIPERGVECMKGIQAGNNEGIVTRAILLEELGKVPGGADPDLLLSAAQGIGYHHAGMASEEREIVERGYRSGALSVLCATSTLAAGVNLPARRVIFKHAWVGRKDNLIDATKYRQMAGRAGRAGLDSAGESVLIAGERGGGTAASKLFALMQAEVAPIESALSEQKRGMKRAMLEVVASGAVAGPEDVNRYVQCTLLARMVDFSLVVSATREALIWLGHKDRAFIRWDDDRKLYQATQLGKAVLASGLSPESCLYIQNDLARAQEGFIMSTELHLTYLCVPVTEDIQPDWRAFYLMVDRLCTADKNVAQRIGLDRAYLRECQMTGRRTTQCSGVQRHSSVLGMEGAIDKNDVVEEQARICRRFWAALILRDLIAERNVQEVCEEYKVARGVVQGLQDRAQRFASMVAAFCERLGWHDLEILISKFATRVLHGVRPEILALTEIRYVKAYTARLLYRARLRTPEAIAVAGVDHVTSALLCAVSHAQSSPHKVDAARRQAQRIAKAARDLLRAKVQSFEEQANEARKLIAFRQPQKLGCASQSTFMSPTDPMPRSDSWRYGHSQGMLVLETLQQVEEMQTVLLHYLDCKVRGEMRSFSIFFDVHAHRQQLDGVAFCWRPSQVCYVPIHPDRTDIIEVVRSLICHPCSLKVTFDLKSQICALRNHNLAIGAIMSSECPLIDVRIGAWMLFPDDADVADSIQAGAVTLEELSVKRLGKSAIDSVLSGFLNSSAAGNAASRRRLSTCKTAAISRLLFECLEPLLVADNRVLIDSLVKQEMPIVEVLVNMELAGIGVDIEILQKQAAPIEQRLEQIEAHAMQLVNYELSVYLENGGYKNSGVAVQLSAFNIRSPEHCARALYELKKYTVPSVARHSRIIDTYTAGRLELEDLVEKYPDEELPKLIQEHRKLTKLRETLVGFQTSVASSQDGRIHGRYNQTCCATGRLSMDDPNLQTVPRPAEFLMMLSQPGMTAVQVANLRSAFVASPGCVLLSADYCQLELRLMAHFSGDATLVDMFARDAQDPFIVLAAHWLCKPTGTITLEDRQKAKQLAYSMLYGVGTARLAAGLGVTVDKAMQLMQSFKRSLPGVEEWSRRIVEECKQRTPAYVQTIAGRKRWLEHIHTESGQWAEDTNARKSRGERQAVNTIVQGSAADLAKQAMLRVHTTILSKLPQDECQLLLQIHDELIFEVREETMQSLKASLAACLQSVMQLRVPLKIRCMAGRDWGSLCEM